MTTSNEIELSRAELAEALIVLSGGEPKPTQTDGLYTNWIVGPWKWSTYKKQWLLIKDPTRDIGEAWKLLPLALAAMTPEQSETFFQRWNDATLFDSAQEEAATWICCNVYAAVEGRTVELTTDD